MSDLLDTSVLLGGVPDDVVSGSISVATLAELHFGLRRAVTEAELRVRQLRLTRTQELFTTLPVDAAVAESWGSLAAHTVARGRQPRRRSMDLLIAATAQAHGLTLVTRDEDLLWLGDVLDVRAA